MSHFFKDRANALDLRSLQSAVLWEWAVSTSLTLQEAARNFAKKYRSFWPLIQLGDPQTMNDRMFDVDEHSVHKILIKLAQYYGKYDPASSTDASLLFQHVAEVIQRHPLASGPVWCKNTSSPRDHAEMLLKKYGVSTCLPSRSPGTLMMRLIGEARLVMSDDHLLLLGDAERFYDGAFTLEFKKDTFHLMSRPPTTTTRVGARPYNTAEKLADVKPSCRSVGGRAQIASAALQTQKAALGLQLPMLSPGRTSVICGSPPLGRPKPRPNALALSEAPHELVASPTSVLAPPPPMRLF